MKKVLIISGSDLSDLSADAISERCEIHCNSCELEMTFCSVNSQNELIAVINDRGHNAYGVIVNPFYGADCSDEEHGLLLTAVQRLDELSIKLIEVYSINVFKALAGSFMPLTVASGTNALISGLGIESYAVAIDSIASSIASSSAGSD